MAMASYQVMCHMMTLTRYSGSLSLRLALKLSPIMPMNMRSDPGPAMSYARLWYPTGAAEMKAFIGAYIWMEVHPETDVDDF